MKNLTLLVLALIMGGFLFQSCNNSKTYAEMKKEEKASIQRYIDKQNIKVLSFNQFANQDSTTNVSNNEFVLFSDNGVYMQIINEGGGKKLEDGTYVILARYLEQKINSDGTTDTISANTIGSYSQYPEEFKLVKSSNSYTGTFTTSSVMYSAYGSTAVPGGWLVPFPYIKVGRAISDRSKVRIIVPHSQGQMDASGYVYACVYDITYQLESPE